MPWLSHCKQCGTYVLDQQFRKHLADVHRCGNEEHRGSWDDLQPYCPECAGHRRRIGHPMPGDPVEGRAVGGV